MTVYFASSPKPIRAARSKSPYAVHTSQITGLVACAAFHFLSRRFLAELSEEFFGVELLETLCMEEGCSFCLLWRTGF